MPLILGEDSCSQCSCICLDDLYSTFKAETRTFADRTEVVSLSSDNLVYVGQQECAVVVFPKEEQAFHPRYIASDDATTCHILVVRHEESGTNGICHLDSEASVCEHLKSFESLLLEALRFLGHHTNEALVKLTCWLFGGFCFEDSSRVDDETESFTRSILKLNFYENQSGEKWPLTYGVGLDMQRGTVFRCHVEHKGKGPEMNLRHARSMFGDGQLMSVYNFKENCVQLPSFDLFVGPHIKHVLRMKPTAQFVRNNFSTTPRVEKEDFGTTMLASLTCAVSCTNPREAFFENKDCKKYKLEGDEWKPV